MKILYRIVFSQLTKASNRNTLIITVFSPKYQKLASKITLFVFKDFIYLGKREKERGEGQRKREKETPC